MFGFNNRLQEKKEEEGVKKKSHFINAENFIVWFKSDFYFIKWLDDSPIRWAPIVSAIHIDIHDSIQEGFTPLIHTYFEFSFIRTVYDDVDGFIQEGENNSN